jgi:hypothetical protein
MRDAMKMRDPMLRGAKKDATNPETTMVAEDVTSAAVGEVVGEVVGDSVMASQVSVSIVNTPSSVDMAGCSLALVILM